MIVKEEELERIMSKEEVNKGKEYALKLLEYRERSEWEIRDRMRRKGYEEKVITETIEFLKNQNLVNDERFARMWTESRLRKSYGRWKISSDLKGKGVDEKLIDEVLKELYSGINEVQIALELVERKWPSLEKGDNLMLRRISSFLKRRGFSFEVIADVMNQITES